jgi:hypothetical protein
VSISNICRFFDFILDAANFADANVLSNAAGKQGRFLADDAYLSPQPIQIQIS